MPRMTELRSPLQAQVVQWLVARGDAVHAGDVVVILEAMKMEHAGIHTALGRIAGRPVGFLANNPLHLGGAIDADAADKAPRFMQLCNAHGLAIVSLVDTPASWWARR
jgi:hypothetical protein